MQLSESARDAWSRFLNNSSNLGHFERRLVGSDIDSHVHACWMSALSTVDRIKKDIDPLAPRTILEVGASAGLNCYALCRAYPDATVIGIEPEAEALAVAQSMEDAWGDHAPAVLTAVGEAIPLPDRVVDLIVCHTVIEHVRDVPTVIAEMSRVLAPGGVIHLEAPNYIWPVEPHLGIFCFPLLGKRFVRFCGRLQGKGDDLEFLEHLKFVHPAMLEKLFALHGLHVDNRAKKKLVGAFSNTSDIKAYTGLAAVARVFGALGLGRVIAFGLGKLQIYPSVLYTIRKSHPL